MSCSNLTSGIAKGCNDQVGGLEGIHYKKWDPTDTIVKDANGVIVQWGPASDKWYFIEADNGQANLTETYEFGNGASVLGFNQSLKFFIPDTATPELPGPDPVNVQNWVGITAPQNKLAIIAETQKQTIVRGYRPKCFGFGIERGAYVASGNKQTGVNYTDLNGYTIEFGAKSKEPMDEVDFMVQHLPIGINPAGDPPVEEIAENAAWNYSPLIRYLGANVRSFVPAVGLVPELWVQPGELVTYKAQVTAIWAQNAFTGGTSPFQLEAFGLFGGSIQVNATITASPSLYVPGSSQSVTIEYTYHHTGSQPIEWIPLRFRNSVNPSLPITEAGATPHQYITIFAQTT